PEAREEHDRRRAEGRAGREWRAPPPPLRGDPLPLEDGVPPRRRDRSRGRRPPPLRRVPKPALRLPRRRARRRRRVDCRVVGPLPRARALPRRPTARPARALVRHLAPFAVELKTEGIADRLGIDAGAARHRFRRGSETFARLLPERAGETGASADPERGGPAPRAAR